MFAVTVLYTYTMKRIVYIGLFIFLGLAVSTLIHALIELPTLNLITGDFETYADSYLWRNWKMIHGVGGVLLWLAGAISGYLCGVKWWQILYVEKRYGTPRF
jgi:amino acid permease